MPTTKILLFTPSGLPGVYAAMRNLHEVCGLDLAVDQFPPLDNYQTLIMGGFTPQYTPIISKTKTAKPTLRVGVWFTSSLGQSDLQAGGIELNMLAALKEMLSQKKLDYLFVGGQKIYEPLRHVMVNVRLLPFPLKIERYRQFRVVEKDEYAVGFFGVKNVYKNVANQLAALMLAKKWNPQLKILINNLTPRHKYFLEQVLGFTEYEAVPWIQNDEDYYRKVASVGLNLQISHADVCDYAAMVSMAMGTPCLMSNVVEWLSGKPYPRLHEDLIVNRFDDPATIARRIISVSRNLDNYRDIAVDFMEQTATVSNMLAKKTIMEIAEE